MSFYTICVEGRIFPILSHSYIAVWIFFLVFSHGSTAPALQNFFGLSFPLNFKVPPPTLGALRKDHYEFGRDQCYCLILWFNSEAYELHC